VKGTAADCHKLNSSAFNETAAKVFKKSKLENATWLTSWGQKFLTQFYPTEVDRIAQQAFDFINRNEDFKLADTEFQNDLFKNMSGAPDPLKYWSCLDDQPSRSAIAHVANALLRVVPTEAAVERSFSAQADTHSEDRNALSQTQVDAEMILKWNLPRLQSLNSKIPFSPPDEGEMSDDDE